MACVCAAAATVWLSGRQADGCCLCVCATHTHTPHGTPRHIPRQGKEETFGLLEVCGRGVSAGVHHPERHTHTVLWPDQHLTRAVFAQSVSQTHVLINRSTLRSGHPRGALHIRVVPSVSVAHLCACPILSCCASLNPRTSSLRQLVVLFADRAGRRHRLPGSHSIRTSLHATQDLFQLDQWHPRERGTDPRCTCGA